MRGHLEEAAGISKYKERRRETENRISHTRENLERLDDLREEVQKQLRHLERQAATAQKYKTLRDEERRVRAELLVLRLDDMLADIEKRDRDIAEQDDIDAVLHLGDYLYEYPLGGYATEYAAALGREPDIEYVPMPAHLKGKYQYHTEAAMAKARAAGYTAW